MATTGFDVWQDVADDMMVFVGAKVVTSSDCTLQISLVAGKTQLIYGSTILSEMDLKSGTSSCAISAVHLMVDASCCARSSGVCPMCLLFLDRSQCEAIRFSRKGKKGMSSGVPVVAVRAELLPEAAPSLEEGPREGCPEFRSMLAPQTCRCVLWCAGRAQSSTQGSSCSP